MISTRSIPTRSIMMKAAAPITGGVSWPLVEEATSTAPAFSAGKPVRFISGMVKAPVVTTLAREEPEIRPVMAEETTDALAGPPRIWPTSAIESLVR